MLRNKHIILGITGGIAAYKSALLARLLIKAGAEVQVVMTPAAKEFITPLTLSTLTGKPVISDFFTANTGEWHSHVDLGLWADCMVIAPATACTIGKMTHGIADNMLVTTYLSARSQVFIAPAMDLDMMAHPTTADNLRRLRSFGNIVIEPRDGELASHLCGKGRMEEPEMIVRAIDAYFARQNLFAGKKILVTAGPTYENIDPVRFIGNYSSGKMGYALADTLADMGADVTMVSGPVALNPKNPDVKVVHVTSAQEMLSASEAVWPEADAAVLCAAVADYAVANPSPVKIKREGNEPPHIRLVNNPDIAATLGKTKKPGQVLMGFALETCNALANARQKLERKNLDAICLNSLADPGAGFGTDTNKVTIINRDGSSIPFDLKTKTEVAADIALHLATLLK